MKTLSVIGIGRLGLPLAAYCAHKGYKVIGVDVSKATVESVNKCVSPVYEPGLDELLKHSHGRLTATTDYIFAVENSDVTFILVPTPSEEHGGFSNGLVEAASKKVAEGIKHKKGFHVIAITSTVMPGTCETVVKPLLERISGKKCGADFGLCYNPEFVALGSVVRDLASPDAVLIGESDKKSGDILSKVYKTICTNNPPIARMSTYNAEVAKLALNVFITTKISLANVFAEICEQLPGGDIDAVTKFLGLDSRIGSKYLKGGLGFGGPCFPRDNLAFIYLAQQLNSQAWLQQATHRVNRHQNERIAELVESKLGSIKNKKIALLGITYKPNTDVVEASAALETAKELLKKGAHLKIYDPAGNVNAQQVLGNKNVIYTTSVTECLISAQLCILATPWEEFKSLTPEDFITNMEKPAVLDCWRFFDGEQFAGKIDYLAIGMNPES
ncbi:MAG: nucleotide sugar dehydrogenase [Dehalococcoidia bacterium]|nr:nucleotide sugar dehydrogenase [Dehalococcoidia bacterium]